MSRSLAAAPAPVALVHDWLTGMRGGEKVLEAIARQFPRAPIHTLFHFPGSVSRELESHPIRTSFLQGAPGLRRHYRHYLPLFPAAVEDLDVRGARLVVSTSHCVAKGVVPDPDALHVCYCHTPMRYAWDQERAYFPRRTGPVARLRAWILSGLRLWDVASVPRVDLFLANSSWVARRIRRYYGRTAEVLHPPVETDFFTPGEEERGEFALVVSALSPYKRVDVAVEACRQAGVDLRIVGDGPERGRLERLAGPTTRFLGRVDDESLRSLYRRAAFVLQPQVEDFGITAVESLACGTPVVAQGAGGVLDIVRPGEDGLLAPEGCDANSLAERIDKSREMLFNKLNLRERAKEFSSHRFRERFRSLLASAARTEESNP